MRSPQAILGAVAGSRIFRGFCKVHEAAQIASTCQREGTISYVGRMGRPDAWCVTTDRWQVPAVFGATPCPRPIAESPRQRCTRAVA